MKINETLAICSLEEFISIEETEVILAAYAEMITVSGRPVWEAGYAGRSVHGHETIATADLVAAYEPRGRLEIPELPTLVPEIIDSAVSRRIDDIRRVFPSVRRSESGWVYVEYAPGQFITPHIDYPHNATPDLPPKVAGVSIQLNDDCSGGEFYVETSGSHRLWESGTLERVADGADFTTEWFRDLPRTRWTSNGVRGTALLFGTQLIHGTMPVREGNIKKLIGFLVE